MDSPTFERSMIVLLLAAASYTIGHAGRLLMRRQPWPVWFAGSASGFFGFILSRVVLAAAAWLVYQVLFDRAPDLPALVALVGLASTPLLFSFVHLTPFFGPGVLRLLYVIALIRLTSLTSLELNMDWLGCLGWWVAAWLVASALSFGLAYSAKNARWLAWTGLLGPVLATPEAVMAEMPGMKEAQWS